MRFREKEKRGDLTSTSISANFIKKINIENAKD